MNNTAELIKLLEVARDTTGGSEQLRGLLDTTVNKLKTLEKASLIPYTITCTYPLKAESPEQAARKFRELVADGTLLVTVTDFDGLMHTDLTSMWEGT